MSVRIDDNGVDADARTGRASESDDNASNLKLLSGDVNGPKCGMDSKTTLKATTQPVVIANSLSAPGCRETNINEGLATPEATEKESSPIQRVRPPPVRGALGGSCPNVIPYQK